MWPCRRLAQKEFGSRLMFSLLISLACGHPVGAQQMPAGRNQNSTNIGQQMALRASARKPPELTFVSIDYPGAFASRAQGINSEGTIVGLFSDSVGTHGFVLRDGKFAALDVPGAASTQARGVNAREEIVGFYLGEDGNLHGFYFYRGEFHAIDVPASSETRAEGINDAGVISGEYVDNAGNEHGYLLTDGKFQTFDVPASFSTDIWMVADDGAFVGDFSDEFTVRGFLKPKRNPAVTLDFPGATATAARWINERDQVVGRWDDNSIALQTPCTTQCHGFLWSEGKFTPIDVPSAVSTVALAMNNRGHIVGFYNDAVGNQHGFEVQTKVGPDE
jgi:uncharacterized membrane protein